MLVTFFIVLLSLAASAGIYFFALESASPLWCIPLFFGAFVALSLLLLVYLYLTSLFLKNKTPKKCSLYARVIVGLVADWVLCLLLVRVRTTGKEKLPDTPFIFVSNHRSAMDPLVALRAFRGRKLCFISKASVLHWPAVGPYMHHGGTLFIERDMPLQSLRTVKTAAKKISEEGLSYGIYPEGTRTKTGKVGEFKEGAFIAAKKAECPIVVITTEGTERIFKRPFARVKVTVRELISAEEVKASTHTELAERTRQIITTALGE